MSTTLSDLFDLVYRRRASLLLLATTTLFAVLSRHVFKVVLPPSFSPTLVVGGVVLIVWVALTWLRAEANAQRLRRERRSIVEHHAAFRATIAGFLNPIGVEDEPEAEVLKEGLLRRNDALIAARRALGRGEAPETHPEVLAKTHPGERADHTGHGLLMRLAVLQREALSAAQRLSLLGEARTTQLDERLMAMVPLHERHGHRHGSNPALALLVTAYAAMLPLVSAQRIATALVAGSCAALLILFESAVTVKRDDEPESP